ncbi:MAG: hypothetical protein RR367_08175 [Clostridia bacterium]
MRTRQRRVTVKRALAGRGGNAFEAQGTELLAHVQPMNGTAAARAYGLQAGEMRLMLTRPDAAVKRGDGVCVDVAATAEPDFRAIYAERWHGHTAVHLRWIPEEERGTDE